MFGTHWINTLECYWLVQSAVHHRWASHSNEMYTNQEKVYLHRYLFNTHNCSSLKDNAAVSKQGGTRFDLQYTHSGLSKLAMLLGPQLNNMALVGYSLVLHDLTGVTPDLVIPYSTHSMIGVTSCHELTMSRDWNSSSLQSRHLIKKQTVLKYNNNGIFVTHFFIR